MTMLTLIHYGPAFGVPDGSPFCVKAEAYLRMLGVEYKTKRGSPKKDQRGQLPVLLDDQQVVCGSGEIIRHLRKTRGDFVDAWLQQSQWTEGFFLAKTVEDHLYFLLLYQRWQLPGNFKVVKREFFKGLPPAARAILPHLVRYWSRQRGLKQGLGRCSATEIEQKAQEAVEELSRKLGDQDYFLGDKPCWLDATMFGFLTNMLAPAFPEGVGDYARQFSNLVDYERRFKERYFQDFV